MNARELIGRTAEALDAADVFFGHGTDNAYDEAVWLVLAALQLPFDCTDRELDAELDPNSLAAVVALRQRRIQSGMPLAYLLGEAWFAGHRFKVDQHTLVPRSPLAELIANAYRPWCDPARVENILEIGTGSGCIAIASAHVMSEAQIIATDISPRALALARENVARHGLADRIALVECDLFPARQQRFDLIVSNPPYVPSTDVDRLPREYRAEPRLGLDGGADGLDILVRMLGPARRRLSDHGVLILDVGLSAAALEARWPRLEIVWVDLEHGGEGIGVITKDALERCFAEDIAT